MSAKRTKTQMPATATVQLGLAAALGDGSTTAPERRLVDLDLIDGVPDKPDPARYPKDEWAEFVQSIQAGGLDYDVIVRPKDGGRYDIVDGRHRCVAHRQLRLKQVPATVRSDYTDAQAAIAEVRVNDQRRASTPYGQAVAWGRARDAGATVEEIAKQAGVAESTVRGRLDLLLLPERLVLRFGGDVGRSNVRDLVAIAKADGIPDAERRAALEAAAKVREDWNMVSAARTTIAGKGRAWFDEHLTGSYSLTHDERLIKKLAAVKHVKVGDRTLFLDAAAAKAVVKEHVDAMTTSHGSGMARGRTATVDVAGREKNRRRRIEAELAAKTVRAKVSYGKDWNVLVVQRLLKNVGKVGTRKQQREAFAAATGIKNWDGYGSSLIAPVMKAGVGSVEAWRILHALLFLEVQGFNYDGVPDAYGEQLMGKSVKAIKAQAKREVGAELKAAQDRAKAAKAKAKGKPAKKGRTRADARVPGVAVPADEAADVDDGQDDDVPGDDE